ncbi:hypothetical protein [Microbacterium gubbeenense]
MPTTARVRDSYAARHIPKGVRATVAKEEFDRWLAAHDAKVRAEEREKADREPSDVEVLAALNARQRIVREQNQMPMETWQDAPSLDIYGTESVEGMRAALIAAQEVRDVS